MILLAGGGCIFKQHAKHNPDSFIILYSVEQQAKSIKGWPTNQSYYFVSAYNYFPFFLKLSKLLSFHIIIPIYVSPVGLTPSWPSIWRGPNKRNNMPRWWANQEWRPKTKGKLQKKVACLGSEKIRHMRMPCVPSEITGNWAFTLIVQHIHGKAKPTRFCWAFFFSNWWSQIRPLWSPRWDDLSGLSNHYGGDHGEKIKYFFWVYPPPLLLPLETRNRISPFQLEMEGYYYKKKRRKEMEGNYFFNSKLVLPI